VKPDLIIEIGVAHGGLLVLCSSILALLEYQEAVNSGSILDPQKPRRFALGVDIDIREHNRKLISEHSMFSRINLLEGSSINEKTIDEVREFAQNFNNVLVILDSNHTHEHVLAELNAYADLVSINSYCIVMGTVIEDLPANMFVNRHWGKGDNPKTAVNAFLDKNDFFMIDKTIDNKLLISVSPTGYLKRVK
jgi:cephalosporin hydroxylase